MHLCICKGLFVFFKLIQRRLRHSFRKAVRGIAHYTLSCMLITRPSISCWGKTTCVFKTCLKDQKPYQKLICSPNSSKIDMSNSPEKRPCPGGFFFGAHSPLRDSGCSSYRAVHHWSWPRPDGAMGISSDLMGIYPLVMTNIAMV